MSADTALPPQLQAAFDRLNATPPAPLPPWPRSVRLGCDYALRAAGLPETDQDADAYAFTCTRLGALQAADPPGDPPATCAASAAAEQMGPEYQRAFALLGRLRDCEAALRRHGRSVADLPPEAWEILQAAARAEPVDLAALRPVLRQGRTLAHQLGLQALRLPR